MVRKSAYIFGEDWFARKYDNENLYLRKEKRKGIDEKRPLQGHPQSSKEKKRQRLNPFSEEEIP